MNNQGRKANNQQGGVPQYGVSQPICIKMPTEREFRLTQELEACLHTFGIYETEDEMQKRLEVLRRINTLVKTWVKKVSEEKVFFFKLIINNFFLFLDFS